MKTLPFHPRLWYTKLNEVIQMSEQELRKRIAAVKTADAVNAIEGALVSDYARELSTRWARGELTDDEMLEELWAAQIGRASCRERV